MLERKIEELVSKFNLIPREASLLVGVSGGPDSVCLLHLLSGLQKNYRVHLYVLYINHLLRKEADEEGEFVRKIASRLNVHFFYREVDVLSYVSQRGLCLEEGARSLRYNAFRDVAKELKANIVCIGHNLDDNIETFLMRLIRGAGLDGLSAIPLRRSFPPPDEDIVIIRPLLYIRRLEILEYLKQNRLDYRQDQSNQDRGFLRNRIRLELIPLLEKRYNVNIKEVLANTIENLKEAGDYLKKNTQVYFGILTHPEDNGIYLELNKWQELDKVIQMGIIRLCIKEIKGNLRRITYQHWRELEGLAYSRPYGAVVDLPERIKVYKKDKGLFFIRLCKKNGLKWV